MNERRARLHSHFRVAAGTTIRLLRAALWALAIVPAAAVARFCRKPVDVGLGPEPLINNVHHKKALRRCGYSVETFVDSVYFITDEFDVRADRWSHRNRAYRLFLTCIFRYRCLYIYFNGGPLRSTPLAGLESWLLKTASIKTVVMPYGGDVQDLGLCPNLLYRHAMMTDYPLFQKEKRSRIRWQVEHWSRRASHVISGCDWVYYMHHWDTLMLAHFSVDTDLWKTTRPLDRRTGFSADRPLRLLHAPNHKAIKGTRFVEEAVNALAREGLPVELVVVQKVSNDEIRRILDTVDVVVEQLIIGWYGIFALEAMAMGRPVVTYIDPKLEQLYRVAGLLRESELPVVRCDPFTVKETIRALALGACDLEDLSKRSRQYVLDHHSLESVGRVFDDINRKIGVLPSRERQQTTPAGPSLP